VTRVLAVRLDSDGDVLLTGPALRALRRGSSRLDLLVSPAGRAAAALLPGVEEVLTFDAPWSGYQPPAVDPAEVDALVTRLRAGRYDHALIFTSFHQSPLPTALLVRLAGIPSVAASSEDYPGSLLDVRHRRLLDGARDGAPDDGGPAGGHEVTAALALAAAAGFPADPSDDGRLALRELLPDVGHLLPSAPLVVVHPGASVPSRAPDPEVARRIAAALIAEGWAVAVTGSPVERGLTAAVTPPGAVDLGGRTSLAQLAAVLQAAACLVVGNTGPAHLAAAVGTPVVSLFSPVVPAARWAPWGVPGVLLGDQQAPCAGSRARDCPVPGHPCLAVDPAQVVAAVDRLAAASPRQPPVPAAGGAR
jgi:ADP-heptose:LPS heptosyltransferase